MKSSSIHSIGLEGILSYLIFKCFYSKSG